MEFRIHRRYVGRRRMAEAKRKKKEILLPEELMEQILSRLPVKSLLRFKCVCKAWYNRISAKDFTFLHFNSYESSDVLVADLITRSRRTFMTTLSLPTRGCAEAATIIHHRLPRKKVPKNALVFYHTSSGACNGIFCLISLKDDIFLWNPPIHDLKIIPRSTLPCQVPQQNLKASTVEFGFDPKTKDYKILHILFDFKGKQHQLQLYSLRTNSWRNLDASTFNNSKIHFCSPRFTTNTKIGWLAFDYKMPADSRQYEIYLFDLSSETFDIIPVSLDCDIGRGKISVLPFRESIAVVISLVPEHSGYVDIWALNHFDSTQSRSWSKLWTIQHKLQHLLHPLSFWGSSYLIFRDLDCSLVLYDILNQAAVDLGARVHPLSVCCNPVYKESLIYISDKKN